MNSTSALKGTQDRDHPVTMALVIRTPESAIDNILHLLDSVPSATIIYQKLARYELYITPYQPSSWPDQGA